MPFLITNVYHQWNTCNSYSWVKKSYGHQTTLFVGLSGGTNISTVDHDELDIFLLHPFTTSVARLHHGEVNNRVRPPETKRWRFKIVAIASLLTQYWLACKLTCTKRNFDTHQSVTDITAAIGTPWLHKLWLGLVLTTGRSSITTFVLELQWTGDCVCGHLLSSNLALDLRWNCHVVATNMLYLLHMTCFELRTKFGTRRVRVYTCTQKIANICDCSSLPPLDEAMIFQAPSFALTMFTTNFSVPWTITVENVISEMCYAIQGRIQNLKLGVAQIDW